MADSSLGASAPTAFARPNFKAVFTDEEVRQFEADYNEAHGFTRRLVMFTLARSSEQLIRGFSPAFEKGDVEPFCDAIEAITDFQGHLKAISKLADSALARLILIAQFIAQEQG
jgi:hypothetical protein